MIDFLTSLGTYFDVSLIILILFGVEFGKVYLSKKIQAKWITLFVGMALSVFYIVYKIIQKDFNPDEMDDLVIKSLASFLATTSCYDYIWKPIKTAIINNFKSKAQ